MPPDHTVKITAALLTDMAACASQVDAFREAFPRGLVVKGAPNARKIDRVVAARLDLTWAARHFLRAPARAEYERVLAAALWRLLVQYGAQP